MVIVNMDNDIKIDEEKLEYLSIDPVTQELYFERERALHEKANLLNTGARQGKVDIVKRMLSKNYDLELIIDATGFTEEEIEVIKLQMN
ncbi:hypothetical protein [Clostridium sp.]|uniref:hypothetical protein n=1 Tax=Clostridium sp. TaxID=1506 RepID=UPI003F2C3ED7